MAARKVAVAQSDWAPTPDLDAGRYLTFKKGEIIDVAEEREPGGWWGGRLANGSEGWFPSSFCRVELAGSPPTAAAGADSLISFDGVCLIIDLHDLGVAQAGEFSTHTADLVSIEIDEAYVAFSRGVKLQNMNGTKSNTRASMFVAIPAVARRRYGRT